MENAITEAQTLSTHIRHALQLRLDLSTLEYREVPHPVSNETRRMFRKQLHESGKSLREHHGTHCARTFHIVYVYPHTREEIPIHVAVTYTPTHSSTFEQLLRDTDVVSRIACIAIISRFLNRIVWAM